MNKVLRNLIIAVSTILFIIGIWYYKGIVVYIIIASILSLIGQPLVKRITGLKIKGRSIPISISAAIALVLIFGSFFLFSALLLPLIVDQGAKLSNIDYSELLTHIQKYFNELDVLYRKMNPEFDEGLSGYLITKITSIFDISTITGFFSSLASVLGEIFIAIFSIAFITFFFLKDKSMLPNIISTISPDKYVGNINHVLKSIRQLLSRYFIGIVFQISIIFVLLTLGLTIAGLDFKQAIVLALIASCLNIIPYIGPLLGTVIGVLIGSATNIALPATELTTLVIFTSSVFLTVQLLDNFVFQPVIFSNSVKAHPLEIFLVILIAGTTWGIGGMVIAIPAYTVLRVLAKEFFNNFKLVKSLTKNID